MSHAPRHLGSTYRLQLNGLGFVAAQRMVAFLHRLGVETCYVSPVTRARAGSTHGYDVADPTALDPSLGTPEQFESLLAELARHDMGLLVDIVPNHMAASEENPFFADVLRRGRDSEFAPYFDIAWDEQDGKILLPVLGRPLAEAIAAGEIRLVTADAAPAASIAYFDHRYPVAPETLAEGAAGSIGSLLARQHYRLADWRVANREVNYRRFFDINELIGVRQEDPAVFAATHRLTIDLAADPRIVGLRVDHVDGLYDPAGYLARLREACNRSGSAPAIVVEKILADGESLPDWPVDGTTGYEFGSMLVGLFVDPVGAADLARLAARVTGDERSFAVRSVDAKRRAIDTLFPHQLAQVTARFMTALAADGEDLAGEDVADAIRALTAHLEVYRTYRCADQPASTADLQRVRVAAASARPELSGDAAAALDRLEAVLLGDLELGGAAMLGCGAWQQLSGPVAAKGVEDTAMYGSGRLLAAADVGADPDRPAVSAGEFHSAMAHRSQHGRRALSSTSTHDSKRSHDVRCRLAVLSEIATEWETTVEALDNEVLSADGGEQPDAADRRYLYETLVGVWPLIGEPDDGFAGRIAEHVVKAAREAKRHSNWLEPDEAYESALQQLANRITVGDLVGARRLVESTVSAVECAGAANSLGSVLIKATAPGVPDTYQGDDAWFLALVDPDNRAPFDVARHLDLLSSPVVAESMAQWRTGAVKQLVTHRALEARRGDRELFAEGRYEALDVRGERRDHVIAFARVAEERWMITVAPRLVGALVERGQFPLGVGCWTDTEIVLPPGCPPDLVDVLTGRGIATAGRGVPIGSVLDVLPVALLSSAG